jgi:threonine aldolase
MKDRQTLLAEQQLAALELRRACRRFLPGHPSADLADEYARMSEWIRANGAVQDIYGRGDFLNAFERRVAEMLGLEAAVFMPSGTMAQQIALRIWSEEKGGRPFAMHPTSHVELHEQRGYSRLHGMQARLLGARSRPMLAEDLAGCPELLSAVLVELPCREIGGQLPPWEDLEALKLLCAERGARLHMDGARLWETRPFYGGRSYREICRGFDSVYVSLYKGIGAMNGALLAGPKPFVDQARVWQRRHGGNLYQMTPFVVSAAMQLDRRIEQMSAFFERARALAEALRGIDNIRVNPDPPHANMMHVHARAAPEALIAARNRVAREDRIWLFGMAQPSELPGWSYFEIYVGENALALDPAEASRAVRKLVEAP